MSEKHDSEKVTTTGAHPFDAKTILERVMEEMEKEIQRAVEAHPEVPPEVIAAIVHILEYNQEEEVDYDPDDPEHKNHIYIKMMVVDEWLDRYEKQEHCDK